VSQFVFMQQIRTECQVTDRGVRKWIAKGRFPKPDGNLNGRNFWLAETYAQWKAEVLDGKYQLQSSLRRPEKAAT
jgi:hypothetical protein